jgi:hypothetical protein
MQLKGFININRKSLFLILIFILGVLFFTNVYTFKEGAEGRPVSASQAATEQSLDKMNNEPPPPDISPEDAQALGDDIKQSINEKMAAAGVPFVAPDTKDIFKQLTDIMKNEINRSQENANAALLATTENITPAGNTVAPNIIDNSFFLGNKFSTAFCDKYNGSQLSNKCASLTADNCNLTDCCVYVNGTKCMAGGAKGPTNITGVTTDADYYLYKYQCYGNCEDSRPQSTSQGASQNASQDASQGSSQSASQSAITSAIKRTIKSMSECKPQIIECSDEMTSVSTTCFNQYVDSLKCSGFNIPNNFSGTNASGMIIANNKFDVSKLKGFNWGILKKMLTESIAKKPEVCSETDYIKKIFNVKI